MRDGLISLVQELGFEPHNVELRIAFGTKDTAWTNHRLAARRLRLAFVAGVAAAGWHAAVSANASST